MIGAQKNTIIYSQVNLAPEYQEDPRGKLKSRSQ